VCWIARRRSGLDKARSRTGDRNLSGTGARSAKRGSAGLGRAQPRATTTHARLRRSMWNWMPGGFLLDRYIRTRRTALTVETSPPSIPFVVTAEKLSPIR